MNLDLLVGVLDGVRLIRGRDVDVQLTWEGIFQDFDSSNIYFHKDGRLLIDADMNSYKDKFMGNK